VGKFINMDEHPGTDVDALREGYASIVPVKIDFTDKEMMEWLKGEWADIEG
jgi:5'-nucleotidase